MHRLFKYMTTKETHFLPVFAASCSKIFGMYGLRVGALFGLTKEQEFANDHLVHTGLNDVGFTHVIDI